MPKKININEIRKAISSEGYCLLSNNYYNSRSKLKVKCDKGHIYITTWFNWNTNKSRCPYCARTGVKLKYSFIKEGIESEGYILKDTEYTNNKTKLKTICPNNHIYYVTYDRWKNGNRCTKCKQKITDEEIIADMENNGFKVLDSIPLKRTEINYVCNKEHKSKVSLSDWLRGTKKCPICSGYFSRTTESVKKELSTESYTMLSDEYTPNHNFYMKYECPKGHIVDMRYYHWTRGHRCPKCSNNVSKTESEVFTFISNLGYFVEQNNRSIIKPYELDIVIPEKRLAIEYCGLYWHSELNGKDKNYHLNKLNMCEEKGYRLVTIFEDEWLSKPDIVKSRLTHILSNNNEVIYARKCQVKEITAKQARIFCEENHLQGYTGSGVKLGLFYNGDIVSVMTFSKPSIAKGRKYEEDLYELSRFCSKLNTKVIGGASKLLKYFERNFYWKEIFSYADRRWSDGGLYEKLGFEFVSNTKPNYWYMDTKNYNVRRHRFLFRKNKDDISNFTEWQNRQIQGYDRIWDCGNLKFTKNLGGKDE